MATITIDDATHQALTVQADTQGLTLTDYLVKITEPQPSRSTSDQPTIEQRVRILQEWEAAAKARAERYPPNFQVDTERETIYKEREDAQL